MTLRAPFPRQQLLFLAGALLSTLSGVCAQDILLLQDNSQIQGKVIGVSGGAVQFQDARGTVGRPLAQIKEVRMGTVPPEFAAAQKALAEKQVDQALASLKALERFKGLPAEWALRATAMVGDAYLDKGDAAKAEAAYQDFQRLYPAARGGLSEIGLARLALAKQDFAAAKAKIEPITTKALEEKSPAADLTYGYSRAFLILGQIKENEGDLPGALENYLRTVTLFPLDRAAAASAQEKAAALRKAHPEVFVP